jgi:uncharacterized Zn-binding protein involved in type VI secretion
MGSESGHVVCDGFPVARTGLKGTHGESVPQVV